MCIFKVHSCLVKLCCQIVRLCSPHVLGMLNMNMSSEGCGLCCEEVFHDEGFAVRVSALPDTTAQLVAALLQQLQLPLQLLPLRLHLMVLSLQSLLLPLL